MLLLYCICLWQKGKPEAKAEKKKKETKKEEQEPAEKKEKKSLTGGVSIEDTKVGSGPAAKPGKVVMVHYDITILIHI